MKHTATVLFISAGLLIFGAAASAQPSFTRGDVEAMMTPGTIYSYQATDAEGTTFQLGSGSSGRVFDFTGFSAEKETLQLNYVDPALTEFPHEFPTATHAQVIGQEDGDMSMYYRLGDDGLFLLGFGNIIQGTDYILKYVPERPSMKFPFQVGTQWSYTSDVMEPYEGIERMEESHVEVIASGTLRLPEGEYECICVREWERWHTKVVFSGQVLSESYITDVSYNFMTKEGASATIVIDSLDENSPTPTLVDASWSTTENLVSASRPPLVSGLSLEAPYPNPVQAGVVTVRWSTDIASSAQLSLVDACGRVLRVLREGNGGVERISVRDLPAGQYFLRLQNGAASAVRPLTVIH